MDSEINKLIIKVWNIKKHDKFHNYIDFIQFPFYRNLEIDTRISFDFPLSVFIGQNGCGKSSCLHALYGAPERYTPYQFWFDTKVDPISYYDNLRKRHSFWYSFKSADGQIKEVIKARIKRGNDPNYWETSRPLAWAGMKTRQDGERDKPISKNVVYLDFRSELSAFDKYFYFGDLKNSVSKNKQEFIRRKSSSLKKLFNREIAFINSSSGGLNEPIEELTSDELFWISYILNRHYDSGLSVFHKLFRNEGFSIFLRTKFAEYSEAFAGSGEMAVVRLVRVLLAASDYSLILLDEPEVSLHPGAQHRLMLFLFKQIIEKKHQIILSSHSPSIISGLPNEAIKVFFQRPSDGRFMVKQNLSPEEAFYHIEFDSKTKRNLIVEDILSKRIVESVLKEMGEAINNLFHVSYNHGGASVLKKEFVNVYCRESNSMNFIIFDGDQKPSVDSFDWRNLPSSKITASALRDLIHEITGLEIKFSVDGGKDGSRSDQQIELLKKYLDYYKSNVFYLPELLPEDIIWDKSYAINQISLAFDNSTKVDELISELNQLFSTKLQFAFIANILFGDDKSEHVDNVQNLFLQRWVNAKNGNFQTVKSIIEGILILTNHA